MPPSSVCHVGEPVANVDELSSVRGVVHQQYSARIGEVQVRESPRIHVFVGVPNLCRSRNKQWCQKRHITHVPQFGEDHLKLDLEI